MINNILELFRIIGRNIKTALLITDSLDRLTASVEESVENFELMKGFLDSVSGNVQNIETYGSKGAQKGFKEMCEKFDNLDSKLDETKQDVAKIKGFLKLNGYSTQTSPEAREKRAEELDTKADAREERAARREERADKKEKEHE